MTRLLHFSDVHVHTDALRVERGDVTRKRIVGALSLVLRRRPWFEEAPRKLRALAALRDALAPDFTLCTGDVTALGTRRELRAARSLLEPVLGAPERALIIAGNHDVYVPEASSCRAFDDVFADYLVANDRGPAAALFPKVRCVGDDVAIVAVESAKPNPSLPVSSGRIPDAQLAALEEALREPSIRDRFIVVATHYGVFRANGRRDSRRHGLENADEFLAIVAGVRRGAVLHGHLHRRAFVWSDACRVPFLCAGSATHRGREGAWVLDVHGVDRCTATPVDWAGEQYRVRPERSITF